MKSSVINSLIGNFSASNHKHYMKVLLISLLLATAVLTQDNLASSGDSSAAVTDNAQGDPSQIPPQPETPTINRNGIPIAKSVRAPTAPASNNFLNQNSLGGNSKWIFPSAEKKIYPLRWITHYTITFTTDCPHKDVLLSIASTGSFFVYINNILVKSWAEPYPQTHQVTIPKEHLKCGCNKIKVIVYNFYFPSYSAIIYGLSQDKTGCFTCRNQGDTFYNYNTCKCECAFQSACESANSLQVWRDYPTCGCRCAAMAMCSKGFFWNSRTCDCECTKKCCPLGQVQDSKTCQCVKQCSLAAGSCIFG